MGKKWRVDNLLSKVGGGIYSLRCCSVDISYLFIVVLVFISFSMPSKRNIATKYMNTSKEGCIH